MKDLAAIKKVSGTVVANLGKGLYRVELTNGKQIVARVSGKMRKYSIQILVDDHVEIEMSIYDSTKGRIVVRK